MPYCSTEDTPACPCEVLEAKGGPNGRAIPNAIVSHAWHTLKANVPDADLLSCGGGIGGSGCGAGAVETGAGTKSEIRDGGGSTYTEKLPAVRDPPGPCCKFCS